MEITVILVLIFLLSLSGNLSHYTLNKKRKEAVSDLEFWVAAIRSKFSAKVKENAKKIQDLQDKTRKPIGEVYILSKYTYSSPNIATDIYTFSSVGSILQFSYPSGWEKFYKIEDEIDDRVKIGGEWHKKKNVIFYDGFYDKKRKQIEKRLNKENK